MATTSTLLPLISLIGNEPASLNTLQAVLYPYNSALIALWWALWCTAAVVALWYAYSNRGLTDTSSL